ncbi:phytoene desaturase family protein [Tunicatimonas pelagia]|uniref:phytoene desaturase family protein n=1 Tax=Tunicatimonas pelagia TaxID=931531 RepID=UPI002666EEE8|nr:NAD(P)/FAD-dependent oxidoreductase [Tunicatimonas pelagia]WKN43736.1 NAD(P)/FAD-dependent oxidoreductase [Tunicatimonas pelagia]
MKKYDCVVIGSGPNGLAAAIELQRSGLSVLVLEAKDTIGGGVRSEELTLPGFIHDVGSAIHPLGVASPFLSQLPLADHGLEWVYPPDAVAHPMDNGVTVTLNRSVEITADSLGVDAEAYRSLMKPIVNNWNQIAPDFLGPLRIPKHPLKLAGFGLKALRSTTSLANSLFKTPEAKGFFAGLAAHSTLPLEKTATSAIGLVLGALGHVVGWPFPKGGAKAITDALVSYLQSLGGEIEAGREVRAITDIPPCRATVWDVTPWQLLEIKGLALPTNYRKQLQYFQYGPGIFKIDWALSDPIPFKNPKANQAATIHLGGTLEEIALSERDAWHKKHTSHPYVLLVHQSPFDSTRAPVGKHTAWAYCHVPRYSLQDMTEAIEAQVKRFAPDFRDTILGKHTMHTRQVNQYNPNYIGGDINGGAQTINQIFTRPTFSLTPYRTAKKGVYLCSSSTPPGGGVHGMCGYHAAQTVLGDLFPDAQKKASPQ